MVKINYEKCNKCGVCINRFKGFCINVESGMPKIDYSICNQCQKCIAICPFQAIMINDKPPIRIEKPLKIEINDLLELYRRRRSCKKYKDVYIPKEVLADLASVAKYAPNQNKNIDIIIIDEKKLLDEIDTEAYKLVVKIYKVLSFFKVLKLFSKALTTQIKKIEHGVSTHKHVAYENTKAMFLMVGDPRIPVTEASAQYMLSLIILYAEALGIGSCLMDSFKLSINSNKRLRRKLGIPKNMKILGVLTLGYPNENIVNIPDGYNVKISWNGDS